MGSPSLPQRKRHHPFVSSEAQDLPPQVPRRHPRGPSGFTPPSQPGLSPRELDCGGDAVGSDTCSDASSGQSRFGRGSGGVSSPPSSRYPPHHHPALCDISFRGGKERALCPGCWPSWHVRRAPRGSGLSRHPEVSPAPPSRSKEGLRTGARRASVSGGDCGMGEPGERFSERRGRWKGARGARRKPEVRAINSGPGASPFPRGWGGRGGWVGGWVEGAIALKG